MVKTLNEALILFSAVSFLFYGVGCFVIPHLREEFVRYGLERQRALVGFLEICGSLGLIAGWWLPLVGKAAAGGLVLLMLCGIAVRIRIRDTLLQTAPAILYFVTNTYLLLFAY